MNKDDNQDNLFLQDKIQPHTKKIFQSQNPTKTQNYQTKSIAKRNPITIIFTTTFTQFFFIYKKNSNFKGKPSFKNLQKYPLIILQTILNEIEIISKKTPSSNF